MHWLDWIIVCIPLVVVLWIGYRSQKYVKSVADFLAAGRVAGRYVICVASGEAGMGLISLVAMWELYYTAGFAISFWQAISMPLGIVFGLTGYCTYRFRETRAMTMGQFFEMRYSRGFRIFASFLQAISGVINYAIFPAVGARCMLYFLDLPAHFQVWGFNVSIFGLLMVIFLSIAVWVVTRGGQVTIMVTDCVQGLLSYPFYAIIVLYIIFNFDWNQEIIASLIDRPAGESMINPYDIENLRTFNVFYVLVGVFSSVVNRMAWTGTQGYNAAAASAHEQKMGGLLGTWRAGFSTMMFVLLAVAAYTYMHHVDFQSLDAGKRGSDMVHVDLTRMTVHEFAMEPRFNQVRQDIDYLLANHKLTPHFREILQQQNAKKSKFETVKFDLSQPLKPKDYKAAAQVAIGTVDKKVAQSVGTIYHQMLVPVSLRDMLPMGITGVLCALMIFLMVSTDTTYMHSWGSVIVQDIVLPIRNRPFEPQQQLKWLRWTITGVAIFAFLFSFFFSQMDYILMFFAITGAIWMGGAGSVIVLGLYWKRGTKYGAFASLLTGLIMAVGGIVIQQTWAQHIYPMLLANNWVDAVDHFFVKISEPFNPYIVWKVTPDKFPVNSQEILFIAMVLSMVAYVVVSLLTCRKPFNMDKLFHRGIYADREPVPKIPWNRHTFASKLIGIDANYTRGDKILAWSVFVWSFVWSFGVCFLGVVIWNAISPWPAHWWEIQFFIMQVAVPGVVAIVSTIWFSIGGIVDLRRLFKRLAVKHDDFSDDGRVKTESEK